MNDNVIRVENLSKMYRVGAAQERHDTLRDAITARMRRDGRAGEANTIWALKDVSFEVARGEVVGVIGRNGAGKSTLLKILSRITEPTSGRAEIHGRLGSLLEVGTGFHPELTGRENIFLNGAILGMKRAEIAAKFDEIVAFAEIEKFLDTPVKRYSSGMYVRLAFAVAAHLEPEILLVDEVLAVGDVEFQRKCLGKMGTMAHAGRTVLFVSHNMTAVPTLCKRVMWLDAGLLRLCGSAESVVSAYLHCGDSGAAAAERVWVDPVSAPGNETVRVRRIGVRPEPGGTTDTIVMQTPLRVEVEYWNLQPGAHLHTTLHVRNDQGIVAFTASAGFRPDPMLHGAPPAGLFSSVCHIPGNLLNSGYHQVTLLLVRDNNAANFLMEGVLGFEVIDQEERQYAWFGREPGVVQPSLSWETYLVQPG